MQVFTVVMMHLYKGGNTVMPAMFAAAAPPPPNPPPYVPFLVKYV